MEKPARYLPNKPFPRYVFIPGENPHPKKVGGHMEGEGDPMASPINMDQPSQNEFLRYAIDLYNYGYFWESHVYFEAFWNAHGRVGSVADFLKGMIKLGAAGVKAQIDQRVQVKEHFERAVELFLSVKEREGDDFLGFNLTELIQSINQCIETKSDQIFVRPTWN